MSSSEWCTIESDPGVFTSLIESFGVKNVELTELWSLDDDSLKMLTNPLEDIQASVHGLIFLFKWQSSSGNAAEGASPQGKPLSEDETPSDLFFARQMTQNACATQAILSVLFNAPNSIESSGDKVDDEGGRRLVLGEILSNFKSFTAAFPPDLKGEAIGSSEEIRTAHNSFGRAEDAFLSDPTKQKRVATDDDDVFHFVAYVPHGEDVYELDGLQCGPIKVGSYKSEEDTNHWIRVARDAIQNRLESYNPSEIKFNLMAMVQDRRTYLCSRLDALAAAGVEESSPDMLQIRSSLHEEEDKRARWAVENERRRFNYLPFCVEYLRCLAASGKLEKLVGKAKTVAGEKRKRAEAWKKES
jgi:ubiquitin carboxyl-terminal hydrolase L5